MDVTECYSCGNQVDDPNDIYECDMCGGDCCDNCVRIIYDDNEDMTVCADCETQ